VPPKIFLSCKTKFLEMTKADLGSPSDSKAITHNQNRESDDAKLIRLTKKLNGLNLKVEEARQKIIDKLKGD
jgi:hypothetical protein